MSMSADLADATLADAYNTPATPFVLLHLGSPGADGTANVAELSSSPIDLKAVTFGAPGNHATNTERRVLSTSEVEWTGAEIDEGQEITHFSLWSGSTGPGTDDFLDADEVAVPKTTGSDGVVVAIGDLEVAIEVFAKP